MIRILSACAILLASLPLSARAQSALPRQFSLNAWRSAPVPASASADRPVDAAQTGKKSGFIAVASSLLLPGMGELYAGRFDRGKYPLITEAFLWLGFAGVNVYGGWIRDDARNFARRAAGVTLAGQDDQFFVDIGNYRSVTDYNDTKLIERNLSTIYPDDRNSRFYWSWASETDRLKYRDQRIKSDEMYNAGRFFIFGLIANRLWSAIESAMFVREHNAGLSALAPSSTSPVSFAALPAFRGISFSFITRF